VFPYHKKKKNSNERTRCKGLVERTKKGNKQKLPGTFTEGKTRIGVGLVRKKLKKTGPECSGVPWEESLHSPNESRGRREIRVRATVPKGAGTTLCLA